MEKRIFQADNNFSQILISLGFIETTSLKNKAKRKRSFKLSKHARKEIRFIGSLIEVISSSNIESIGSRIDEEQLKHLLLFFYLSTSDYKAINNKGYFDLDIIYKRLSNIKEYIAIEKQPGLYPKITKVERRILDKYNKLKIAYFS